ncbi:uncharacterized protein N7498_002325 [Penicillium cinerascens]|uniref:DUF833-domain-containing protein n=1 Tax=Penicillium cinerascens TaxID=70096 RepID=A0A9W9NBD7_9EURO|nr:uncharacterized protein N7498_002325 [Penicillium cinerascens]KAJ5215918.1 hypothetical protein N7498_002325 [Penicillium cinerascens]
MCIAVISTAHPLYSLIIIDNRDEYLRRPTSSLDWWPEPSSFVLGSRDLARAENGTWMGVTKQGKIAVLTNYRENKSAEAVGWKSRGKIVNSWLTSPPSEQQTTRDFVQAMVASPEAKQVGGFSLVCGHINEPLAIVSNRSHDMDQITWVASEKDQTRGLSNTSVDDRTWLKIVDGERLTETAIKEHAQAQEDEDALVERLLQVLSTDTLPRLPEENNNLDDYITYITKSIFVPVLRTEKAAAACADDETKKSQSNGLMDQRYFSGLYGTQKQTVLLARPDGRIRYFERTLYDNQAKAVPIGQGDKCFEFTVSPEKVNLNRQ